MFQHFGIQELYLGCLGIGFLYVAGSLMLTGVHTGHGAGRIAGNHARGAGVRGASSSHSSTGHARVAAHSQRIAHASTAKGAHHATRVGTARATRAHAAPSAAKGDSNVNAPQVGDNQQFPSSDVRQCNFVAHSNDSQSDLVERAYFSLMGIFNPMSISMCLFFFGLSGLVVLQVNPALARASMLAALVIAIFCTSQMQKLLGKFAAGLESSALRTINDSIGLHGEISISIPAGRIGEVVFVLGQSKRNYSAKAANPDLAIQRGTKVIIVDVEDSVVFVEPFDESFFASEF